MAKNINNILILGGAGFIGSNLTKFFVKNNKKIIIFDKENATWDNLKGIKNKIKIIKGNFDNPKILEKIFDENQIDIVIHLISMIIPGTPFDRVIKEMELTSSMKLIEIMKERKVKKIIYFSSGGVVYGKNKKNKNKETDPTNPINFYGWLKLAIEKYILMSHNTFELDYIILRPSNPYGPNQNIYGNQGLIAVTLGKIIKNRPIDIWGDGKIVRDYIYIDDLCKTVLSLINKNKWNNIYNIGSGKGTNINDILKIIKKVTKINFKVNYKKNRKVDIPVNVLNISKVKKDTNYSNLIDLEEGISLMWEKVKNI